MTRQIPELRQRFDRRAVWLGALGLPLLVHAVWNLRWAHRYRQSTREGLAFVGVFTELTLATLLLGAAAAMLGQAASWCTDPTERQQRRWGWMIIATVLAGSWAVSFWIAAHGHRCVGPCGPAWFGA